MEFSLVFFCLHTQGLQDSRLKSGEYGRHRVAPIPHIHSSRRVLLRPSRAVRLTRARVTFLLLSTTERHFTIALRMHCRLSVTAPESLNGWGGQYWEVSRSALNLMEDILSLYCKCTSSAITKKLDTPGRMLLWAILFWYVSILPADCTHLSVTPWTLKCLTQRMLLHNHVQIIYSAFELLI
jgi:hypothetical protein